MKQYYNAKNFYYRGTDYIFKNKITPQPNLEFNPKIEKFNNNKSETCVQCATDELKISKHDPKYWGPRYWFFYHTTAINYPEKPTDKEQDDMEHFIRSIPLTLPCKDCKKHAKQFIDDHRIEMSKICSSRENLFKFFVDFHNKVSERNGKPTLTYDEALKIYK